MSRKKNLIWWILLLAGLVIVNVIASQLHSRYDLTQEKRYSLTGTTKNLIRQLKNEIKIDVFLNGDFPAQFRKLSTSTQEFLSVLKESNPSKVAYRLVNPQDEVIPGKTWGDSLKGLGVEPINVTVQVKAGQENKVVFPYALVKYGDQQNLVNLFPSSKRNISVAELNNAEAMMEYQFASKIDQLLYPEKLLVAYSIGNGEPTGPEVLSLQNTIDPESMPPNLRQFFPQEKSNYQLRLVNLHLQPFIPDTFKVLLIVKPASQFSDSEKLKIDQYVMRGGKVLWFIDNLYAEPDSLSMKSQLIAYDRNLNLQDLLFNYGVRINPDLIMDLQCDFLPFAVGGNASNPQFEFLHWNYYPLFESRNNHPINKNIGLVAGRFVNSIDTVGRKEIKKTLLLQSSANSRTISTPALISPNENRNTPEDALFRQHNIPAAVLLEGRFTSLYKSRIGRALMDSLEKYGGGFRKASEEENKMIVVADGDIVLNDVSPKNGPLPMGMNLFTVGSQYEYQFANKDFLLNCLEYLTSKESIIKTRNKEIVLRLLDMKRVQSEKATWQIINIALPVFVIILFGFFYQQLRKRKFAG